MKCIGATLGRVRRLDAVERLQTGFKYVVRDTHVFRFEDGDATFTVCVPAGFRCDGSSGWRDVGHSWILHDWLYARQQLTDGSSCSRKFADRCMLAVLRFERNWPYFVGLKITLCICGCRFQSAFDSHEPAHDSL